MRGLARPGAPRGHGALPRREDRSLPSERRHTRLGSMIRIDTNRLIVTSGTEALAAAELGDPNRFASLLGARVPEAWPPETLRDVLSTFLENCRARINCGCWTLPWYVVLRSPGGNVLCGSIGFKGPPSASTVELGYAVLPDFQRRGIATE